ncbi:MAG: sensor histidine kinase [Candidatus Binatia bacterium]
MASGVTMDGPSDESLPPSSPGDHFLSILSHELRTPLQAMAGWLTVLRQHRTNPPMVDRAAEALEQSLAAQVQIVEDLIEASRIVAGAPALAREPVEVRAAVTAWAEALRPAAESAGVALTVHGSIIPVWISADRDGLGQIARHLIRNAIKFTPRDGRVDVHVARIDGDCEVTVCDTGEGIAAEALPLIFDRFTQADSTITRGHGGLGLGLAIVKHVAEAHRGAVQADSAGEGQGATFRVRLPLI